MTRIVSLSGIRNYLQVSENIASSGQPDAEQFQAIAAGGYAAVVNLAMPDSENAIPREGDIVTSLGMSYFHIPVPFDAPGARHLRQFIKLMEVLSAQKVWVHCALNYRASAFLYQYRRLAHDVPSWKARAVMLKSWEPDEIWEDFMALSRQDVGL